ncbi:hypothetical protein GCM10020331_051400 [Ectobacillus funiculus]
MIHFVKKVYKVKMETDIRKYCAPGRGSEAWKKTLQPKKCCGTSECLFKRVLSVEKNVRYRTGKRAKVHFDLVTLVYNASKISSRPHETTTT